MDLLIFRALMIVSAIILIPTAVAAFFSNIPKDNEKPLHKEHNIDLADADRLTIAVDFDNTLAVTRYPAIIAPIGTVVDYIRDAKENHNAIIILWTCREGKELEEAVAWCKENNVPIDYVNENVPARVKKWESDCRKVSADIYIDDKAMNMVDCKIGECYEKKAKE